MLFQKKSWIVLLSVFWLLCINSTSVNGQTNNGFVGIYSDSIGTQPCSTVPPLQLTTLYVIGKLAGGSSQGITSAEFRIEVPNPDGWILVYAPPPNARVNLGNPLDLDPVNPTSGANIVFDDCLIPSAGGQVQLGTITVFNLTGSSTDLLVKRHSNPTNASYQCPLFTLCDAPAFSKLCMTPSTEAPCSLSTSKVSYTLGSDPAVSGLTLNGGNSSGAGSNPENPAEEIVAMFKVGIVQLPLQQPKAALQAVTISSTSIQAVLSNHAVETLAKAHPDFGPEDLFGPVRNGGTVRLADLSEVYRIKLPTGGNRQQLIDQLEAEKGVLFAELGDGEVAPAAIIPNDPDFSKQYSLLNTGQTGGASGADIKATLAWEITKGHVSKRIAILDFGMDMNNIEFAGKSVGNTNTPNATSPDHGSLVAGIAAANTDNSFGIAGVDWNAELVNQRIDFGNDQVRANTIRDAATVWDADILNHSWRMNTPAPNLFPRDSQQIRMAFRDVYMMNRINVVAMSNLKGPNQIDTVYYPAAYPQGIIAVGATDDDDTWATFSHIGPHIDVSAPGVQIWSTRAGDAFGGFNGNSFSAPQVSGLASLLLSVAPHLANDDVEQLIRLGTNDVLPGVGFDDSTGTGRINALKTLQLLESPNRLLQLEADGQDSASFIRFPALVDFLYPPAPGFPADEYVVSVWELRKHVTFPVTFPTIPEVWGRGVGSQGYRDETVGNDWPAIADHFLYGFCEPVPGTITTSGCTLRTYVYENSLIVDHGWFPMNPFENPESPHFEYTVLGQLTPTDVGGQPPTETASADLSFSVTTPARIASTLQFNLPRDTHVNLSIYDVMGRRVAKIFDEVLGQGEHTYQWLFVGQSGQRVSSGLYFARLAAGQESLTRKILLLQ